jgi:hypothetical protein
VAVEPRQTGRPEGVPTGQDKVGKLTKEEMASAGFCLQSEGPSPAPDRFLLVFGSFDPDFPLTAL